MTRINRKTINSPIRVIRGQNHFFPADFFACFFRIRVHPQRMLGFFFWLNPYLIRVPSVAKLSFHFWVN